MTRRTRVLDRLATLLAGLALVAGGLALLDWRYRWVLTWQDRVSTRAVDDVESTWWWPWAFAIGGVVVALLGLLWILAHVPSRADRVVRIGEVSDEQGSVRVDLASVASALAADLQDRSQLADVRGSVQQQGRGSVVVLRAHLDPDLPAHGMADAAAAVRDDLAEAFPEGTVALQVLIDRPRRRRASRREATARVD